MSEDIIVEIPPVVDDPRLGRVLVHDVRSRAFPAAISVDTNTWKTRLNGIFDPFPNPSQTIGNCTGCDKAMQFNSALFRTRGTVHKMDFADRIYQWASANDPFEGSYPPDDTGSSGLAACKAAQFYGVGGEYRWLFGGADEVVQAIVNGETVGCGTWWTQGMSNRKFVERHGQYDWVIEPTGRIIGGHQYRARGYIEPLDMIVIRCWWGAYRDVLIKREHLNERLMDGGDANVQKAA